MYLYLSDMRFSAHLYPIFYLPVRVSFDEVEAKYQLEIEPPHLYVNKGAIDFVQQERAKVAAINFTSPIKDRIVYVDGTALKTPIAAMESIASHLVPALDLPNPLDFRSARLNASASAQLRVTTAAYLAVFDRSDESLLNDYEELLAAVKQDTASVHALFESIVQGLILNNPIDVSKSVNQAWEGLSAAERLVAQAPIPLNDEQRKILQALREENCKFVQVSGPPGTGKSHTITAIAFDCILNQRSVLILSDKKEALDVVQDKLEDTLQSVRYGDGEFPNPILRLGKGQANYRKLTAPQALARVQQQATAYRTHESQLKKQTTQVRDCLKQAITTTISTLSDIKSDELARFHARERRLERIVPDLVAAAAKLSIADAEIRSLGTATEAITPEAVELAAAVLDSFESPDGWTLRKIAQHIRFLRCAQKIRSSNEAAVNNASEILPSLHPEAAEEIVQFLRRYEQLRMPLFGFLFRGRAVRELNMDFASRFETPYENGLHTMLDRVRRVPPLLMTIKRQMMEAKVEDEFGAQVYQCTMSGLGAAEAQHAALESLEGVFRALTDVFGPDLLLHPTLRTGADYYPTLSALITEMLELARYTVEYHEIHHRFASLPDMDYVAEKTRLEQLYVSAMAGELDNRFLDFMTMKKAIAKSLAGVIKSAAKFPTEAFADLRDAMPCIIAGIREFAEYVPLQTDVFDVVIIDEASQVSVAQAFPALLRAKRVVVFGDQKQFSNVKSMNASKDRNSAYLTELDAYFNQHISTSAEKTQRLKMFDVKKSVLEFMELVNSYSIMLTKHFRGYQELISFSSKYFYGGQLQAIKVRGRPLEEVIVFHQVPPSISQLEQGAEAPSVVERSKVGPPRNTNAAEAEFIRQELRRLVDEEIDASVGIITPFREQQQLLTRLLFEDEYFDRFSSELDLKIMTFDSCQGEERDLIYYSLVATAEDDKLNYIFPIDIIDSESRVEEILRMQRLNVGFSRAKECIRFVMSKPIEGYRGSMRKVLQHYATILNERGVAGADDVDPHSPMERKVLDWLYKTSFWQMNRERLELIPQFKIGDYLRQLDRSYQHPRYRADFLVRFYGDQKLVQIIIEYDGLKEHFTSLDNLNSGNYEMYYRPEDIERQMVIESYGYRVLRINRFTLGEDPVATLSARLSKMLTNAMTEVKAEEVSKLRAKAEALDNGEAKMCSKCGKALDREAFYDPSLGGGAGGYGRICLSCKGLARHSTSSGRARTWTGYKKKSYRKRWWR